MNEKNVSNINLLEIQFETEKKEQKIQLQEAMISKKNILNFVLIGSSAALLIISVLSYRSYRQTKKLQDERIATLEKEKQL